MNKFQSVNVARGITLNLVPIDRGSGGSRRVRVSVLVNGKPHEQSVAKIRDLPRVLMRASLTAFAELTGVSARLEGMSGDLGEVFAGLDEVSEALREVIGDLRR